MLGIETLALFFVTSVLLALAPGPDNIFVLTHSAQHGRKAGWFITLGLCTGLCFHTALVALGFAAIFRTSPVLFHVITFLGAGYLVYLAWGAWHAQAGGLHVSSAISAKALYLRGIIMNVSNPKVALFFLAYLPQFMAPALGSPSWQTVQLGITFMLAALLTFSVIAALAAIIAPWLQASEQRQIGLDKVAAVIFLALALRLFFDVL